jgi:SNF2-related domain
MRFGQSRDIDPTYGDNYVAIFFDEAHMRLKKKTSKAHKAATSVKSKHKILMTASPQVRSPLEVFTMAAVAKGIDLNTPGGRRIEAGFISRFCETVGGRVVGVKQSDPAIAREFRTFIKRNLFYEDKRSGVGEAQLGTLSQEVEAVSMPADVEVAYREVMAELLQGLKKVAAQRFEGDLPLAVESAKVTLRGPLAKLTRLSDTPDRVVPGATNPKLDRATQLVDRHISGRTLLFTESKDLAADTFERMKKTYPGKSHAMGLVGSIVLFNGATGEHVKFTSRVYADPDTGRKVPKEEWKTHVLSKIIQRDPTISTMVLTGSYAVGQNLQSFGNVIHLDRDDWSNEVMKQRTARAWRAGNLDPVNEYTLDLVYSEPDGGVQGDMTLDEIRRTIQSIDARLFQEVVLDSQSERLGLEWLEIKKQRSSLHQLDRKMVERAMSPYAKQLGRQEAP